MIILSISSNSIEFSVLLNFVKILPGFISLAPNVLKYKLHIRIISLFGVVLEAQKKRGIN